MNLEACSAWKYELYIKIEHPNAFYYNKYEAEICDSGFILKIRTRDGSWTRTSVAGNWILSPARLPIPPPRYEFLKTLN